METNGQLVHAGAYKPSDKVWQCQGTTKKGVRCKAPACVDADFRFCEGHRQAMEAAKRRKREQLWGKHDEEVRTQAAASKVRDPEFWDEVAAAW